MAPKPAAAGWLLVVLAQQRSGTTALRRTLAAGAHVADFGEVFHDKPGQRVYHSAEQRRVNFHNYKRRRVAADPEFSFPTKENQLRLWNGYLALLRRSTEKPLVTIDVKYNSWHHLNSVWYGIGNRPDLVPILHKGDAAVLHVIRSDVFAQACSSAVAKERAVWHVDAGEETPPPERMPLDPRQLAHSMRRSVEQTEMFRRWFAGNERYAEVEYESLFDGDRLSSAAYEALRGLTGIEFDEGIEVPLGKVTPSLAKIVENPDEISSFFQGSSFEEQVKRALAPVESAR